MNIKASDTVGSIVGKNLHAAHVFRNHGLDFCCGGKITLKNACKEANVSVKMVLRELAWIEKKDHDQLPDFTRMEIDELTRFIEKFHHEYTVDSILNIKSNIERLVRLHGRRHPELEIIEKIFDDMAANLTVHMKHEEFILFPYIRKMVKHRKKVGSQIFRSVTSPIATIIRDHENEGERLKKLDALTHHYTAPDDACITFKATYAAMKDLEADLHVHLHLENNILFPRATELENTYANN